MKLTKRLRIVCCVQAALIAAACSDGPTDPPNEDPSDSNGTLVITLTGLPSGAAPSISLTGPGGLSRAVGGSESLRDLPPGIYTVSIRDVTVNGLVYGTAQSERFATIVGGQSTPLELAYRGFNMTTANFYVVQSIQESNGSIPLVAGRSGYLRVFASANNTNTVATSVRVRVFNAQQLKLVLTIPPSTFSVPNEISEGNLSTSWNVLIPGELVQPGLAIQVDIDPDGEVTETDEGDNRLPLGGSLPIEVRVVPRFDLMLVPIRQGDGTLGNVTPANAQAYLKDLARMFPINETLVTVREPYVTDRRLRPDSGWTQLLGDLEAVRVAEGAPPGRYYYGVAKLNYDSGIYGIAYRPGKTGLGNDYLDSRNLNASMTLAHEMGHSMGRPHSQCGTAAFPDVEYPHANGQIGSFGLDLTTLRIYAPTTKDLMGYCEDRWIGDFTYRKVLEHRLTAESTSGIRQPTMIVWGRIEDDQLVLEPAFDSEAIPTGSPMPGPYLLEGLDGTGASIFSISFEGTSIEDGPAGARAFAFALPLDDVGVARLSSLRLRGGGLNPVTQRISASGGGPRLEPTISTKRVGNRLQLQWDAAVFPLLVLRNPVTGRIVSLLRGGRADLPSDGKPFEAFLSDGLRSRLVAPPVQN